MKSLQELKIQAYMLKSNIEDKLAGRGNAKTQDELDQKIVDAELRYWKKIAMNELQDCQNLKFVHFVASFLDESKETK